MPEEPRGRKLHYSRGTYCSKTCERRWRTTHPNHKPCVCKQCGKEFTPKESNRTQFCSRECGFKGENRERTIEANQKRRKRPYPHCKIYMRNCAICRSLYAARTMNQKYCSSECQGRSFISKPIEETFRCAECGNQFLRGGKSGNHSDQIFCSERCRRNSARRDAKARRRAKCGQYDGMEQRIRFSDVWDRTGGRCHVCGGLCARHPERFELKPTIDHIVPLSMGGTHLIDNAGIAHFVCNSFKGSQTMNESIREASIAAVAMFKSGLNGWEMHPLRGG